jgi:DNA-binding GntR family transcriptional regulator
VRGRGTFAVASPTTEKYLRSLGSVDDLLALSVDTELEVVKPLTRVVDLDAAGRLRLGSDEVYRGLFRRLHEGAPFSATTIYLPPSLGERIALDGRVAQAGAISSSTVIGLIEELIETPIAEAHQSITAGRLPAKVGPLIGCEERAPALRIDRLYFGAQGTTLELAMSWFNPARYSYRLALRRRVT